MNPRVPTTPNLAASCARDRTRSSNSGAPLVGTAVNATSPGHPRVTVTLAAVETPTVGVVGAGQLARMLQEAAIALGVPLRLLAEAADSSAAQAIPDVTVGDYTDRDVLRDWARGCAVVTFDHEHVPTGHLGALEAEGIACRPGPGALV